MSIYIICTYSTVRNIDGRSRWVCCGITNQQVKIFSQVPMLGLWEHNNIWYFLSLLHCWFFTSVSRLNVQMLFGETHFCKDWRARCNTVYPTSCIDSKWLLALLTSVLGTPITSGQYVSSHLTLTCFSTCISSDHLWLHLNSLLYMQINTYITGTNGHNVFLHKEWKNLIYNIGQIYRRAQLIKTLFKDSVSLSLYCLFIMVPKGHKTHINVRFC